MSEGVIRRSRTVVGMLLVSFPALVAGCGGSDAPGQTSDGDDSPARSLVMEGQSLYDQTCAGCHGADLRGTSTGPPFLDPVYAPNHHPDESFYAAVADGVQPHHWDFGAMPPQPSVAPEDVAAIIAYVRSEQEEAGISEDPSHP